MSAHAGPPVLLWAAAALVSGASLLEVTLQSGAGGGPARSSIAQAIKRERYEVSTANRSRKNMCYDSFEQRTHARPM